MFCPVLRFYLQNKEIMKFYQSIIVAFLLTAFITACAVKKIQSSSQPVSHEIWNELVGKYVTEEGKVDYKGFVKDSVRFNEYLAILSSSHPNDSNWNRQERLAYWLNAYNAFTVQIVARNYPQKSIKDIKNGIPFVNTVWDIKFIKIENETYDLNNIEHGIVRPRFEEPRVHFALNCASVSCPRLRNEAYTADKLEAQLTDQAKYFLNNPVKNKITPERAQISKLFSWFKGDFTKNGKSLRDFINQYSEVKINPKTDIDYLDYDWNLNE